MGQDTETESCEWSSARCGCKNYTCTLFRLTQLKQSLLTRRYVRERVTRMFTLEALVWAQPIHDTWSCHLTLLPCRHTAAPGGFVETTIAVCHTVCGKQACMQQQRYCPHDVAKREQRGQGSSLYWWHLGHDMRLCLAVDHHVASCPHVAASPQLPQLSSSSWQTRTAIAVKDAENAAALTLTS